MGTKSDLRSDKETINKFKEQGLAPITFEQGEAKLKELKYTCSYIECSALTRNGIDMLLYETARAAGISIPPWNKRHKSKKGGCIIL